MSNATIFEVAFILLKANPFNTVSSLIGHYPPDAGRGKKRFQHLRMKCSFCTSSRTFLGLYSRFYEPLMRARFAFMRWTLTFQRGISGYRKEDLAQQSRKNADFIRIYLGNDLFYALFKKGIDGGIPEISTGNLTRNILFCFWKGHIIDKYITTNSVHIFTEWGICSKTIKSKTINKQWMNIWLFSISPPSTCFLSYCLLIVFDFSLGADSPFGENMNGIDDTNTILWTR